ncbi:ABC transporter substrate-binding protein [Ensifer sp. ENS04]|uniref:ABC transporter substrate-binding protein n=1 Tax=Ensifer sp. ENS04 TaxID=2769281 RepID=UPI0017817DED|nr:ABC transporter substrate-binding protein [Ensifer sp. ENS04]MBD9541471.1 ABC transporter substrate-binding protein [Ensifer sp. ENS04]
MKQLKATVVALGVGAAFCFPVARACADVSVSNDNVRIGVLVDLSGIYADLGGQGSVEAAKMAVEDFGGKVLERPIDVISSDVQNKADISASKAREWYDSNVDLILEGGSSSGALAIAALSTEKKKVYIPSTPGTSLLTNEKCGPYVVHYTYDTYALANVAARAVVGQEGKKDWFFITLDYAFGHTLEKDASDVVVQSGGTVVGSVKHPMSVSDFSSYVLEAQRSKASVIALANAASDTQNTIKAAKEFGVTADKDIVGLLVFITDVHALGLEDAQGMLLTDGWYWDLNDETRAFAKRFYDKLGKMPTMVQAGNYSAVLTYLKAIEAAGTDDADAVMAKMKSMKVNDVFAKNGYVRADGRFIHDMYLMQVKSPSESKYSWDYYTVRATIPGDEAFQPLSQSRCSLVKKS